MNVSEILEEIHNQKVELEIYQALQQWLLSDRKEWIHRAMESESTVKAVKNIAIKNKNPKDAINGIINICSEEE